MRGPFCEGPTHFGPFFALGVLCGVAPKAMCCTQIALRCPSFSFPIRAYPAEGCRMP
jgi:hypothetical protein